LVKVLKKDETNPRRKKSLTTETRQTLLRVNNGDSSRNAPTRGKKKNALRRKKPSKKKTTAKRGKTQLEELRKVLWCARLEMYAQMGLTAKNNGELCWERRKKKTTNFGEAATN